MSRCEKIWNKDKCKTAPKLPDCLDLITSLNSLWSLKMCCFSNFSIAIWLLPSISCTTTPIPAPSQKSSVTFWSEEKPHSSHLIIFGLSRLEGEQRRLLLINFLSSSLRTDQLIIWKLYRKEDKGDNWFWIGRMIHSIRLILCEELNKQVQSWVLCSRKHLNGLSIHLRHGPSFFIPPWQHVSITHLFISTS